MLVNPPHDQPKQRPHQTANLHRPHVSNTFPPLDIRAFPNTHDKHITQLISSQVNKETESQSITFCSHCHKPSTPEHTLKPCIKCQSVQYCNKECQKADFKRHKKECAKLAQEYAKTADFKMAKPAPPRKDAHLGGLQKWQFDT